MNITEVRIRLIRSEGKMKAIASITIDDCFVVHDIKVIKGEQEYFVSMPTKKTPTGEYRDIVHPLNTDTRERIRSIVLAEYDKVVSETPQENSFRGSLD